MQFESSSQNHEILYVGVGATGHILPFLSYFDILKENFGPFTAFVDSVAGSHLKDHADNFILFENSFVANFQKLRSGEVKCDDLVASHIDFMEKNISTKPKLIIADMFAKWGEVYARKHNIPVIGLHSSFFNFREIMKEKKSPFLGLLHDDDLEFCSVPEFFDGLSQELVAKNPNKYIHLGPLLQYKHTNELDSLKLDQTEVIYVSLGTVPTTNSRPEFFENVIKFFENKKEITLCVSLPQKLLDGVFKDRQFPNNVIVKSFWPQLEVLKIANLFFSHGGMNSTIEGLIHKVPMIIVPGGADQFDVGKRVDELEIGTTILSPDIETIQAAYEKVKKNEKTIRANLEKYASMIDEKTSRKKFIDAVSTVYPKKK